MWYVYYTGQCGDAACAGAGNEIYLLMTMGGATERRDQMMLWRVGLGLGGGVVLWRNRMRRGGG